MLTEALHQTCIRDVVDDRHIAFVKKCQDRTLPSLRGARPQQTHDLKAQQNTPETRPRYMYSIEVFNPVKAGVKLAEGLLVETHTADSYTSMPDEI